jgi:anti-sigma factor RsiW
MARLDGEPADLDSAEIQRHAAGCPSCASAIEALQSLHTDLTRQLEQQQQQQPEDAATTVDLWPSIEPKIAAASAPQGGRATFLLLAGLVVAWRIAQLSWADLPGPVVNSLAPLAMIVILLRRLAGGDPFAFRSPLPQLQQKGALSS